MGTFTEALTECPCKNCICVAVCQNKGYIQLLGTCDLVAYYLYDSHVFSSQHRKDFFYERLQSIQRDLNTNIWEPCGITGA
jgi:hypothetical protein